MDSTFSRGFLERGDRLRSCGVCSTGSANTKRRTRAGHCWAVRPWLVACRNETNSPTHILVSKTPIRLRTDRELAAECFEKGAGDERLFAEIFRRHKSFVWSVCRRYFSDPADLADITQDVFFRAFRNLGKFVGQHPSSFRAWLGQIAANICKNELRTRSRRPQISETLPDSKPIVTSTNWAALLESREDGNRLEAALKKLTPEQRQIIELADLQELPYSQITEILGLSLSAVKMRTLRARAALATHFRKVGNEDS